MSRPKLRNYKKVLFCLDMEINKKVGEIADFQGMSKSEFIEFLVNNWERGINPYEKFKHLTKEREKIIDEHTLKVKEIDNKIAGISNQIQFYEKWSQLKKQRKEESIKILMKKILNNELEEAEEIAKARQRMTSIPAIELLSEAKRRIDESGV